MNDTTDLQKRIKNLESETRKLYRVGNKLAHNLEEYMKTQSGPSTPFTGGIMDDLLAWYKIAHRKTRINRTGAIKLVPLASELVKTDGSEVPVTTNFRGLC